MRGRRRGMRTPGLVLALLLADMPAAAQDPPGDSERGRALAERRCAKCHQVLPGSRGPSAVGAPAFQAVADDAALTEATLRAFLRTSHEDVPTVPLTPEETGDVVAYLLSLKGWRPGL
jgi:mono/diheme cytochrome c family protein